MHEEFCMVSDFPEILRVDDRHRPHCDDGPSHRWRDGWSLYYVHGVRVPEYVVMRPHEITLQQITAESNAEVRRVMIERYGDAGYIVDSGAKAVAHDERFGTLYHIPMNAGRPICKIRVLNRSPEPDGTFRVYWLSVNPEHYDGAAGRVPQAAVASTWRKDKEGKELFFQDYRDYAPDLET